MLETAIMKQIFFHFTILTLKTPITIAADDYFSDKGEKIGLEILCKSPTRIPSLLKAATK